MTRRVDDHIDLPGLELLRIAGQPMSDSQRDRLKQLQTHLEQCSLCAEMAQSHGWLRTQFPVKADAMSECFSADRWLELAAGLLPAEEAATMKVHADSCAPCGIALKEAMQDMERSSLEEDVYELTSSSEAWQKEMAKNLAADTTNASASKLPRGLLLAFHSQSWRWLSAAAVLLIAIGGSIWFVLHDRNSEQALLARAYDAQRRTDLRLPGGSAVAKAPVNRGDSSQELPTELLELQLRVAQHLQKKPDDPYWLALRGQIELVKNNGERAKKDLELAAALGEKGLDSDLAAAWFEIGDANGDTTAWAKAADFFGRVLEQTDGKREPQAKASAYFNQALCWERLSVFEKAIASYQSALALEKDPGWRKEIEQRLQRVKAEHTRSATNRSTDIDLSPAAFLAATAKDFEAAVRDYELYLDAATRQWNLEDHESSAVVDAAWKQLATVGRQHQDEWPGDLLTNAADPRALQGIRHLRSAALASSSGNHDQALAEADTAAKLFREAHSEPGEMRAEAERVYAFQRMGKVGPCLETADKLLQRPSLQHYTWMRLYVMLEHVSCGVDRLDVNEGVNELENALRVAKSSELRLQALRAESFLVTMYDMAGETRKSWQLAIRGLETSLETRGARMATYQFLHSLYSAANTQGLRWTAAGLAEAAADASQFISNIPIKAYSQEVVATAAMAIGHYDEADAAFTNASSVMSQMPPGEAAKLYRADWATDRSSLQAHRGQLQAAISAMKQASSVFGSAGSYSSRQHHNTELANLLLQAGQAEQAMQVSLSAINDAENGLDLARGEAQKLAWERDHGRGYRLLVQSLIALGRKEDALKAWEWYRSAPFRAGKKNVASTQDREAPALPPLPVERRRGITLVVARLEDRYVAWSISATSIHMAEVQDTIEQIELMAKTFGELCSNRNSSPESIHLLGEKLYRTLFASFDAEISSSSSLQFDLDTSLRRLPVAAFVENGRGYLGLNHALVRLPPWWVLRDSPRELLPDRPRVLLVEGASSVANSKDGSISTLPEEYLETKDLIVLYPQALVIRGQENTHVNLTKLLSTAELFHIDGHRVERGTETGLLLSNPDLVFSASWLKNISMRGCRLAVVATCSSTEGNEYSLEDHGSLPHALLLAGAHQVAGTLWDVDSKSSRELMLAFYSSLQNKTDPATALQKAQQTLSGTPAMKHPFFWAATEVFTQ